MRHDGEACWTLDQLSKLSVRNQDFASRTHRARNAGSDAWPIGTIGLLK
jgi:hypothetical protein